MNAIRHGLARFRDRHAVTVADGDAGTTMIELFVAMILMTICGSIFTGSIISLYRTTDAAQAVTTSAQQNNQAYQSLDRTVRYASAISKEARSTGSGATGDQYVELRNTTDGTERCTQLRVDIASQQLQRRTWRGANPAGTLSAWQPLASGITNGAATDADDVPFLTSVTRRPTLRITLIAQAGPVNGLKTSRSSFTLAAVNGQVVGGSAAQAGVCQQVGRP